MRVETLIEILKGYPADAVVKLNDIHGSELVIASLFYPRWGNGHTVLLESKDDIDVGRVLEDWLDGASENDEDELDVFMDILNSGFALEDFEETNRYEYAKQFMEEHGLV